jgi:probable HAF family extracellular repeat protein
LLAGAGKLMPAADAMAAAFAGKGIVRDPAPVGSRPGRTIDRCAPRAAADSKGAWQLTEIGVLPGGEYSKVFGINNAGEIVGYTHFTAPFRQEGFLYRNGSLAPIQLGTPMMSAWPQLINNRGQIAGYTWNPQTRDPGRGFLYERGDSTIIGEVAEPFGINDKGQIVGVQSAWDIDNGRPTNLRRFAFLYEHGTLTDLSRRLGIETAVDINNAGHIVGQTRDKIAYRFAQGKLTVLGTLPGDGASRALAINQAGSIVGASDADAVDAAGGPAASRAFLYRQDRMIDLNARGGFAGSHAFAINGPGQVLGSAIKGAERFYFLYSQDGFINLNALPVFAGGGWSEVQFAAMNDRGQLVGTGMRNGTPAAFMLTPPEARR